jgi:hypothetical protein
VSSKYPTQEIKKAQVTTDKNTSDISKQEQLDAKLYKLI